MNEVDKIRFWINEVKNFQINKNELWGFMRMSKKSVGLPYDIYIDNGGMYKTHNHELWLYVQIGNEKIPVTINDNPEIKKLIRGKSDVSLVCYFIKENQVLLQKLADGNITLDAFFALLRRYPDFLPQHTLEEMATLRPMDSGLVAALWLDDDKLYEPHAPRIKFQPNAHETNTNNFIPMQIENPNEIHHLPKDCQWTTKQINQIKAFVIANKENLLKLANNEIEIEEFKASMKIVDEDGNVIISESPLYFKPVNGFAKVKFHDKYDFADKNGEMLIGEYVFDDADNFNYYGNLGYIAHVVLNGEDKFIDTEGNYVTF